MNPTSSPVDLDLESMPLGLRGKVAIITGGARGQGAEEARRFAAAGASAVIADIARERGVALAASLGAAAIFSDLDVSDEGQWSATVGAALDAFGRIDVLVNNAGVFGGRAIADETSEHLLSMMSINLVGAVLGVKSVVESMSSVGGGSVINVGSIASIRPGPGRTAYVASKAALQAFGKVAASELAAEQIRVNTVLPGTVDTDMFRAASASARPGTGGGTPAASPRLGQPSDIADLVLFLASDRSGFINGADFVIDGGWTLVR